MKSKAEITRYRNKLEKADNSRAANYKEEDEEIRNKIRNWLPDEKSLQTDEKINQLVEKLK